MPATLNAPKLNVPRSKGQKAQAVSLKDWKKHDDFSVSKAPEPMQKLIRKRASIKITSGNTTFNFKVTFLRPTLFKVSIKLPAPADVSGKPKNIHGTFMASVMFNNDWSINTSTFRVFQDRHNESIHVDAFTRDMLVMKSKGDTVMKALRNGILEVISNAG